MPLSRRKLLIGAGGIVAAGGALVGTGAFTTVQAERTVNVETAGDANAFLTMEPAQDGNGNPYPNAQDYVTSNGANGTIEIDIGGGNAAGDGVNLDAITHIDRVFQVTNNGTQPVVLYIEELPTQNDDDRGAVDIGTRTDQLADVSSVGGSDQPSSDGIKDENRVDLSYPSAPDQGGPGYEDLGVLLGTGDTLELGVYIDTSDANLNDGVDADESTGIEAGDLLLENIAIWADANEADSGNYEFEAEST